MNIYVFFEYFLAFLLYSIIGWCIEVILGVVYNKKFIDRGFLLGPYCPIYGFGCVLIVLLLQKYTNNFLVLFILSMVICLVLEYMTSYLMELIFKARWWDYSNKKFNINGRVCLEYAVLFGVGGSLIIYLVHPFVIGIVSKLSSLSLVLIGCILLIIFVVDNIISFNTVLKVKGIQFKAYVDNTEEVTKLVKEYLMKHSKLTKRLVFAFPNVRMGIEKIQKQLKK